MRAAALVTAAFLAGCSHISAVTDGCPAGMQAMWQSQLLFGRNVGGSLGVRESDWKAFVAAEIAPRFPSGFTVTDAAGVWRGDDGKTVHEPSKVLAVLAPAGADTRGRLDAIASAYKVRFRQDAVGMAVSRACASF